MRDRDPKVGEFDQFFSIDPLGLVNPFYYFLLFLISSNSYNLKMSMLRAIIDDTCQHPRCKRGSLPEFFKFYCDLHQCPIDECNSYREEGDLGCTCHLCQAFKCSSLRISQKDFCEAHLCQGCQRRQVLDNDGPLCYRYCKTCICQVNQCSRLKTNDSNFCHGHRCSNCLVHPKEEERNVCFECICSLANCTQIKKVKNSKFCEHHRCKSCDGEKDSIKNYCRSCMCQECGTKFKSSRRCNWPRCRKIIRDDYCSDCTFTIYCKTHECRSEYCHDPVKTDTVTGMNYVTCLKCHITRKRERCPRSAVEGTYFCEPCNKRQKK